MEDKKLSEKESLELITQMIHETQTNTARYAAYPLLIWGYLTSIISVTIWFGLNVFNAGVGIMNLWLALPLIAVPLMFYFIRKDAPETPKNYMERINGQVWMVFGIVGGLIGLTTFFKPINVLFVISLMMSMATTLSGLISKYKPLIVCGSVSILLSFILVFVHLTDSLLIFAAIFVVMMVIPGHIFNKKQKESC